MAPWHQLPQNIYTLVAENPGAILLETARCDTANQTSHLFLNPIQTLAAQKLEDLPTLFADIEAALAQTAITPPAISTTSAATTSNTSTKSPHSMTKHH